MRPVAASADVRRLPVDRSWMPWGIAGSAVVSAAGYSAFLLGSQVFPDPFVFLPFAIVTFLMTAGGIGALLGIGAHYIAEPATPRPPIPRQAALPARSVALPRDRAMRLVAPLADEIAGTMAPADARLRTWNGLTRVVDGVPVFTFRWNLGARTDHPVGFRAVAVPLAVPADGVRSRPLLVSPGDTSARLVDFPDVRAALAALEGSWVTVHRNYLVLHVQELGGGTMPTRPRIAAAIAVARAVDAASEAYFWQRPAP